MKSRLSFIPLSSIKVGERFRKDYGDDEMHELIESIRTRGIIQPISIDQNMNLLAGGRRHRAASLLKLEEVPCIILNVEDEVDAREIELIENIHRLDMTWLEKTLLVKRIHDMKLEKDKTWTQAQTAKEIGRVPSRVAEALELATAIEIIPELRDCKNESDARKQFKALQEKIIVDQMLQAKGIDIHLPRKEDSSAPDDSPSDKPERPKLYTEMDKANDWYRIGNALEGLKEIIEMYEEMKTTSSINVLEIDPPYGIALNEQKKGDNPHDEYHEVDSAEYSNWMEQVAQLAYAAASTNAWCIWWFGPTWFCETKRALEKAGWDVDDIPCIWVKSDSGEGGGQTNAPEYYLGRAWEPFFICRKGNPLIRNRGRSNVFNFAPVPGQKKYHPTQRPIALMREILRTFAYPKTIICVPFLGSGVTLRAINKEEMLGFGWDLSEEYKKMFLANFERDGD